MKKFLQKTATGRIKENPVIYRNVMASSGSRDKDMLAHTRRWRTIQKNSLISNKPKTIPKVVKQSDFVIFLDSVNLLRDKLILLILKEGGLRIGELLGIKLEDIDFAEQGVWIRFRPDNINGSRAKAGFGRDRFVHLPSDLMALIDDYISSNWIKADSAYDYLFLILNSRNPSHNGKPMKKTTIDSLFRYHTRKTGVHIHPHQLRHTHATELVRSYIQSGEPINWEYISKRLGHASVTTTMEIYSHLLPEDYKKEYAKLLTYHQSKQER